MKRNVPPGLKPGVIQPAKCGDENPRLPPECQRVIAAVVQLEPKLEQQDAARWPSTVALKPERNQLQKNGSRLLPPHR